MRGGSVASCGLGLLIVLALPSAGGAEAAAVLLFKQGGAGDPAPWRARLGREPGRLITDLERFAGQAQGLTPERLAPLSRIEELLVRARGEAAALAESEALSTLAEAARIAEQLGDLPGAAFWNAEIQLGIGITAAQASRLDLAEEAFRRAATLDPGRGLLPAEATPAAVELYERVKRQTAVAALGELEVRAAAAGAQVYLDEVAQGASPVRMRARVGRHLLRVEAPGHRAYGAFIDVLEGARAILRVAPAPEPAFEAQRALQRAAAAGDYAAVPAAVHALQRAGLAFEAVLIVERDQRGERALIVRCTAAECRGPLELSRGVASAIAPAPPLDSARLVRGRRWLAGKRVSPADTGATTTAWWQRWYVWGGLATAAGVAAAALAVSAASEPERRLQVVVDPQDLGD